MIRRAIALTASLFVVAGIAAYAGDAERYGPILNPGTPDAAVMIDGWPVQIEYLRCVPAWRSGRARYLEDGSIAC